MGAASVKSFGYLIDSVRALGTSMRQVFRPVNTVQFPDVIRPRAERYRASFALLHDEEGDELCIGCLQCERICPSQVIAIKAAGKRESPITGKKRGYADDFTLDMSACIFCELCVQVCPTDAIVMTREQDPPAYSREDLVLTMDKLYANEKSKTRSWGDATKLMGMQEAPKAPKAHAPAAVAATVGAAAPAAAESAPATKPSEAAPGSASSDPTRAPEGQVPPAPPAAPDAGAAS
ncbi:MAG: NADH-quinone oxidoreductase subunit I [Planctomycetota bacterium]|nr:NADH-quinone oxidoreductase subunit I [Planctomycetota bacterium]